MEKKRLEDADLLNDDETLMAYNEIKCIGFRFVERMDVVLQSFDHEDIIHTHGVYHGKHANSVYLVMDLCEVNLYTVLLNELYSFSSVCLNESRSSINIERNQIYHVSSLRSTLFHSPSGLRASVFSVETEESV